MSDTKPHPKITAIGVVSWDETLLIDRYPAEGDFAFILKSFNGPGGTTGNTAMAARHLGADVSLHALVGCDERGDRILEALGEAGVDTGGCMRSLKVSDLSQMLVSRETSERTIFWDQQPSIKRRDRIDSDALFNADVTVVDCVDYELRKFLSDLPAHTRPAARLLGTLTYLADVVADDKLEVALRHDILVGNDREYRELLGVKSATDALESVAEAMPGHNLRLAVMTRRHSGAMAVTRDRSLSTPAREVTVADTTGAGDAFAGALAFAVALRWDLERSLRFANAVASIVVTEFGAQTALPTYEEALAAAELSP
jgi:ribokinase